MPNLACFDVLDTGSGFHCTMTSGWISPIIFPIKNLPATEIQVPAVVKDFSTHIFFTCDGKATSFPDSCCDLIYAKDISYNFFDFDFQYLESSKAAIPAGNFISFDD